jgi:hypothetical protein
LDTLTVVLIVLVFFIVSTAIAIVAVMAGIGGGVIFTPIMLAFTNVNSLVIRATGILISMASSPISTGIFAKKGLINFRLCLLMAICQSCGALIGANIAISTAISAGLTEEGLLRLSLGIILLLLSAYFIVSGKSLEWPVVKKIDKLTHLLNLGQTIYEESEGLAKKYNVKRVLLGAGLIIVVGIIGGFFGMGGGWAITPALNMGMGIPLKISAANTSFILGISGGISIWPYVFAGSIIPIFVLPWVAGQIVGGLIGSFLLVRVKAKVVKVLLIGIMFFTSFTLIARGLEMLGVTAGVPAVLDVIIFILIMAGVGFVLIRKGNA